MTPLALALLASAQAVPAATAEDEKLLLATEIAAHSPLSVVGPLFTEAEVQQIADAAPELTPDEREELMRIGRVRAAELGQQVLEAEATALAALLALEDLQAIAEFERSPAAAHRLDASPAVLATVFQQLIGVNYKAEVRQAFCQSTGKLCE